MEQKIKVSNKLKNCFQAGILLAFVAMILACTSSESAVDKNRISSGENSDHALKVLSDSVLYCVDNQFDFAYK